MADQLSFSIFRKQVCVIAGEIIDCHICKSIQHSPASPARGCVPAACPHIISPPTDKFGSDPPLHSTVQIIHVGSPFGWLDLIRRILADVGDTYLHAQWWIDYNGGDTLMTPTQCAGKYIYYVHVHPQSGRTLLLYRYAKQSARRCQAVCSGENSADKHR